jgi:uncharacterized peroxidase-related enzyme
MPHIDLPVGLPGISSAFAFRPETAKPMRELAHKLLFKSNSLEPGTLSSGERELIATYVSGLNDCHFCQASHGAAAASHLADAGIVKQVKIDFSTAPISEKLKSLLVIAGKVQSGGKQVSERDVAQAREFGATDLEIHDTVLIAAAFCMYNRYVDGLATWQPREESMYQEMGQHLASKGYLATSIK